jgi:hypothetical protein
MVVLVRLLNIERKERFVTTELRIYSWIIEDVAGKLRVMVDKIN